MSVARVVNVRVEACEIYIGRPSAWGNPFTIGKDGDRGAVIRKYRDWIATQPGLLARIGDLRGKILGCYCSPSPCHGDVILEILGGGVGMIELVISGGQSGADLAGWVAAKAAGIPTAGAMIRGFMAEDGPHPEYAEMYGAWEIGTDNYADRTVINAGKSDGTLWFGDAGSRGGRCTATACRMLKRPMLVVKAGQTRPSDVLAWCDINGIRKVNVAGNRASVDPELGPKVERFLASVFRLAGERA